MSGPTVSESDVLVTRKHLASRIRAWADGELSNQQMLEWAHALFDEPQIEFDDLEDDEYNSAAKEVLSFLERLDMNLAIPEDAPIHLRFLETRKGYFDEGYERWLEELDEIDLSERREALREVEPYARYLREEG